MYRYRVFYYFGERYDTALLIQACLMIAVQLTLLKVALDNRGTPSAHHHHPHSNGEAGHGIPLSEKSPTGPPPTPASPSQYHPFHGYQPPRTTPLLSTLLRRLRAPRTFWRWSDSRPYYMTLLYLTSTLTIIQLLLPRLATHPVYISLLGSVGLTIEATLPLPQIYKNYTAKSCRGFRLSVIVNWLLGDAMKMGYFFGGSEIVPWPFKACGLFQAACDCVLGLQFWVYGSGSGIGGGRGEKGILG